MSEVCSVVDVNQFAEVGHSLDKCGFYATALLKYAGKPGVSPSGNASDVANWADAEYVKYDGADIASNGLGMDMASLVGVIKDAGLHYMVVGSTEWNFHVERLTADYVRAWLRLGYPVILAVAESNVYDQDLGGSPYAWPTDGLYHIITATGVDGSAILCHDTASIAPDGVRVGPRRYDAGQLQSGLTSATAVVLPWLQRPQGDFDPIASGGHMSNVPQGWHDDGTTLVAPNGIHVVKGFRDYVLAYPGGWDAANVPLEPEQALSMVELANHSGAGTRQLFRTSMLCWYATRGVVMAALGNECYAWIQQSTAQAKQIATLEAELKAAQTPVVSPKIDVPGAIAALSALTKDASALKTALGIS